jgi:putative transposase
VSHLVGDGAYGTQDYLELAKGHGMYLISRLRDKSALYFPFAGKYKGSGRPKVYGDRCSFEKLPKAFFKEKKKEKGFTYYIYQFESLSKSIRGVVLNVVVVRAIREKDGKVAYKVFFSNDRELGYEKLLDYYSLRFQIEFNFRDAKQYFGFSDFKNYKQKNLTNFVNLSFLMCLINKIVLEDQREKLNIPKLNTADLKVIANGRFTAKKIIKLLQKKPDLIFNNTFCEQFLPQELIHST